MGVIVDDEMMNGNVKKVLMKSDKVIMVKFILENKIINEINAYTSQEYLWRDKGTMV